MECFYNMTGLTLPLSVDRFNLEDCKLEDIHDLEDAACKEMLRYAKSLSIKYHNPARFDLSQEDLFGELMLEVAKSINVYLHKLPYDQYKIVTRRMLYYRICELTKKAYGTHHANELTADVLSEDLEALQIVNYEMEDLFRLPEFSSKLSTDALKLVNCILEPDAHTEAIIKKYIDSRSRTYKNGAGVNGLPPKVLAEVLGVSVKEIRPIINSIKEVVKENDIMVSILPASERGKYFGKFDAPYSDKLVTCMMVRFNGDTLHYGIWRVQDLRAQAIFRGLTTKEKEEEEETRTVRSKLIKMLTEDDEKNHGIAPGSAGPLIKPATTLEDIKKNKNLNVRRWQPAEDDNEEEDDDEDYRPLPPKSIRDMILDDEEEEVEEKVSPKTEPEEKKDVEEVKNIVDELNKSETELPDWLKIKEEPEVKLEEKLAVEDVSTASLPNVDVKSDAFKEVISALLENLRKGESIVVTKISDTELKFDLQSPISVNSSYVKLPELKVNSNRKYAKGSKEWRTLVHSKVYLDNERYLLDTPLEQLITEIKEKCKMPVKLHKNKRIQRKYCIDAFLAYYNVEKFNEEFKSVKARAAITLES